MEPSTSQQQDDEGMIEIIEKSLIAEYSDGHPSKKKWKPMPGMISVYVGNISQGTTYGQFVDFLHSHSVIVHNPSMALMDTKKTYGFFDVETTEDYEKLLAIDEDLEGHKLTFRRKEFFWANKRSRPEPVPGMVCVWVGFMRKDTCYEEFDDFLSTLNVTVHNRWLSLRKKKKRYGTFYVETKEDYEKLLTTDRDLKGYKLMFKLMEERTEEPALKRKQDSNPTPAAMEGSAPKMKKGSDPTPEIKVCVTNVSGDTTYDQFVDFLSSLDVTVYNPWLTKKAKNNRKWGTVQIQTYTDLGKLQAIDQKVNGQKLEFKLEKQHAEMPEPTPGMIGVRVTNLYGYTTLKQFVDFLHSENVTVHNPWFAMKLGKKRYGLFDVETEEDYEKLQAITRELKGRKLIFKLRREETVLEPKKKNDLEDPMSGVMEKPACRDNEPKPTPGVVS